MASTDQVQTSPPSIFRPRIRDGMIVVRRPANRNDAAIFWTGTYLIPPNGTNGAIFMDFPAFLADLEAHFQYDPDLDEIHYQIPSLSERFALDAAQISPNDIQSLQPEIGIVRTYSQWVAALGAMQASHLMRRSSIEYVLRSGMVTSSVRHRVQPVAAAQFFIVRTSDTENSNQEGNGSSGQV